MPSGAKKRKIAKKKKGQQTLSYDPNSSGQLQGSDAVKHYDDKESDGGSPASQDHRNFEHPFAEGDEQEIEKRDGSSSGQSDVSKNSSLEVGVSSGENVEKVATQEGIVQIEWELKSEEDYGSKDGSIESKEVHTGGSSSSSSSRSSSNSSRSSSDDESHVQEKTEVVETRHAIDSVKPVVTSSEVANKIDTTIPAGEISTPVTDTATVVTPNKASLVEDIVQVNESASGDYSATPVGYKLEVQESADNRLPTSDDYTKSSAVLMDLGLRKDEESVLTSEENPAVYVDAKDSATEGKDDKLLLSFNAPNVHTSKDADRIKDFKSPDCSESQPLVASVPQAAPKTSLKSCCGIFELFTSSDR